MQTQTIDQLRVHGFLRSFSLWLDSQEGREASQTIQEFNFSEVDAAKVLMRHFSRSQEAI